MIDEIIVRQGEQIDLDISSNDPLDLEMSSGESSLSLEIENSHGTTDYNYLTGKPKINGVTVVGEKEGQDYRLQNKMNSLTVQEIEKILYL